MCPDDPVPSDGEVKEESGSDRRKHPRAKLQLLIQFRFESFDEFVAEYSEDLSVGGLFIRTDHPREEGSFVYFQFTLKDGSRLIEGLGKVARSIPPGTPNKTAGMGVEFVNIDGDSLEIIEEIVARRVGTKS